MKIYTFKLTETNPNGVYTKNIYIRADSEELAISKLVQLISGHSCGWELIKVSEI